MNQLLRSSGVKDSTTFQSLGEVRGYALLAKFLVCHITTRLTIRLIIDCI